MACRTKHPTCIQGSGIAKKKARILQVTDNTPVGSNRFMVKKTGRAWRMCGDIIGINKAAPKDCYSYQK
ncbi:hypothetical protein Tco_0422501 [Tanacetum coccineum]